MATKAPDPRDFKSWEDAFQYPVPVVRKFEQQLRGNINENREKLRSLVGASYRDLLGTAERIVDMDVDMQQMETVLGDVGRKCSARAVEMRAANYAKLARVRRDGVTERRGLASTIALLQACMMVAGRMIKRTEKPLLAAKLLVLARLLHNSASRSPGSTLVLDNLRTKLGNLRRRLLNALDRQLGDVSSGRLEMLDALTAFSLATSSTPTDVLRHFLHVRQQRLVGLANPAGRDNLITALDSIFLTLRHTRENFPKRMADTLARLKSFPLLQDPDIRSIDELDLDIYERWIADDVRNFTPWPRHDELSQSQAARALEPWSVTVCEIITSALRRMLDTIPEPQEIADLRETILRHVLGSKRDTAILQKETFVQDLRTCFSDRLSTIISERAKGIEESMDNVLQRQRQPSKGPGGLWDSALADVDLRNGATAYRQQILSRNLGKDDDLQDLSRYLDSWSSSLDGLRRTIKTMKDIRWDDDLDFDDDDEEADAEQHQASLGGEDPDALSQQLYENIKYAFSALLQRVQDDFTKYDNGTDQGHRTVFLLRVTKEVMGRQNTGDIQPNNTVDVHQSLLDQLYIGVADYVDHNAILYTSRTSAKALSFNRTPATTLWEGAPPLPVQPSPACIRFLHEVRKTMQSTGTDLWTKNAVDSVKQRLVTIVKDAMEKLKADLPSNTGNDTSASDEATASTIKDQSTGINGDTVAVGSTSMEETAVETEPETESTSTTKKDVLVQAVFDTAYLQKILVYSKPHAGTGVTLEETAKALEEQSGLEVSSVERVRKSAADYHKRSYLLFGILSPS